MQTRQMDYHDINQCSFLLTASSPENNLNLLPDQIRKAFVLSRDYLYYIDKDAPENKCTSIKIDSIKLRDLKPRLGLNENIVYKDEVRIHIENMNSEQIEAVISASQFFPGWLHKIIFLSRMASDWQRQVWERESYIRTVENQIVQLEKCCPKKFLPSDLEYLYPNKYKSTPQSTPLPTDFKVIKLGELHARLKLLDHSENKKALANQQAEIKDITLKFNQLKLDYLKCEDQFQKLDKQLSDYSKEMTLEAGVCHKYRSDVRKLSLPKKVALLSLMPGAVSLSVLMDIFTQLKREYENELHSTFLAATKKKLKAESFEKLFEQIFSKSAKEHFKEFAKKPTPDMSSIADEFRRLNREFWEKTNMPMFDQSKHNEFNQAFLTLLYLVTSYETFMFTDKVQRLDVGAAIRGFFTGDNVANEFLRVLTATQIQNSFAMMPYTSAVVCPTEATCDLWLEAAIWLHGLHQRAFSQLPPHFKEKNSVNASALNHLGDDDDRQFFENKAPLVKWAIAQYHEPHFATLLSLLPSTVTKELLPCLSDEIQNQYKTKHGIAELKPEPLPFETVINNQVVINEPPFDSAASNPLSLFPPITLQSALKETLPEGVLNNVKDKSSLVKFNNLQALLQKYDLNEEQQLKIQSLKTPILSMLESYKNAWFSASWVPTIFKSQTHIEQVTNAYNNVKTSDSPRSYILELIQLWNSVYCNNSTTIGPNTEVILLDILVITGVITDVMADQTQALKSLR